MLLLITALNSINLKEFYCRKCNKLYKHQQSRSRHEIKCNEIINNENKNENIISTNNSNSIENNGTNNNTTNNIENNGNINNNTNNIENSGQFNNNTNNGTINNITINNYGNENTGYVSDNFMFNITDFLLKNTVDSLKDFIPLLIENIHLNEKHKENNNIQFNNLKSPIAKQYIDNKWTYTDKEKLIEELHDNKVIFAENWIKNNKDKIPIQTKEKLNNYKKITQKYKKKNIYPEINKRGYLYYKNNMENRLDK